VTERVLSERLNPLANPIGLGYSEMVTVFRAYDLRVVIFFDDHQPAHVHVFGEGQARINLLGSDGRPELIWTDNMTRGDVRHAMRIVVEQQTLLLARWEALHGRID
jgi:hypothetical protein